ncbi:MAG: hypothetical protein U0871_05810 [Gemmataceae bacterium]
MTCAICQSTAGTRHTAREVMFGTRDEFTYFECGGCGCLQLVDPPADLGRYYPANYYSLAADPVPETPARPGGLRGWVAERRNAARAFDRGGFWGLVAALRPRPDVRLRPTAVRDIPGLSLRSRMLDVGCGGGGLLVLMDGAGFRDLTGADPFRAADARPTPRVRLLRRAIEELDTTTAATAAGSSPT